MERIYSRVDHAHLAHDHFLRGEKAPGAEVYDWLCGDACAGLCGGQGRTAGKDAKLGVIAGGLTGATVSGARKTQFEHGAAGIRPRRWHQRISQCRAPR